jgi:hypothetical protein
MDPEPITKPNYGTLTPRLPQILPPFENLKYVDSGKAKTIFFCWICFPVDGVKISPHFAMGLPQIRVGGPLF